MSNYEEVAKKVQSLIQEALEEMDKLNLPKPNFPQTHVPSELGKPITDKEKKLLYVKGCLEDAKKWLN